MTFALFVTVVASLSIAAMSAVQAFEAQKTVAEATDLRLAVLTVASVDDPSILDQRELQLFGDAVDVLERSTGLAASQASPAIRTGANHDLSTVAEHGRMLLGGMSPMHHSLASHADLEDLLREDAERGARDAAAAQQQTGIASAIGGVSFLSLGVYLFAHRSRRDQERVRAEEMGHAADRFSALLDESLESTAIVSPDGTLSYQAASLGELFAGTELTDSLSIAALAIESDRRRLLDHLQAEGAARSAMTFQSVLTEPATNLPREFLVRVSDLRRDSLVGGWLVAMRETTVEAQANRALHVLAETDPLTGLPNRRALMRSLQERTDRPFGFLMADLDGFKKTNDSFGHHAGDELLITVGRRFQNCLSPGDEIYRLAGDEFAIITTAAAEEALSSLAARLVAALDEPIQLSSGIEHASASVGTAIWNTDDDRASMLHRADIAMYEAKDAGGNRIASLTREIEDRSVRRSELRRSLDGAVVDREFSVVYQPILNVDTGRVSHVEALLRWDSPVVGSVGPDTFIPMAEHSGKIIELGLWVLERACADLAGWRARGDAHGVGMTINVSPFQLREEEFFDAVEAVLLHHGLQPDDLTIEVTESAIVRGKGASAALLEKIRALGCHVACDDFGSGYSNLGQLMSLPLDVIKIDRGLINRIFEIRDAAGTPPHEGSEVSSAILTIAASIDAIVIAEGIETSDQRDCLASSGVTLMQGYFFSRPLHRDNVEDFIRSTHAGLIDASPRLRQLR